MYASTLIFSPSYLLVFHLHHLSAFSGKYIDTVCHLLMWNSLWRKWVQSLISSNRMVKLESKYRDCLNKILISILWISCCFMGRWNYIYVYNCLVLFISICLLWLLVPTISHTFYPLAMHVIIFPIGRYQIRYTSINCGFLMLSMVKLSKVYELKTTTNKNECNVNRLSNILLGIKVSFRVFVNS